MQDTISTQATTRPSIVYVLLVVMKSNWSTALTGPGSKLIYVLWNLQSYEVVVVMRETIVMDSVVVPL